MSLERVCLYRPWREVKSRSRLWAVGLITASMLVTLQSSFADSGRTGDVLEARREKEQTINPHAIPCVSADPAKEDFARVLEGGRYFAHADGTPFIPIGGNHNLDWPELEESNPLAAHADPQRTEKWFEKLHAHGVNVVRLMVETPQSGNLEEKVGTFREDHIVWLDRVFLAARHQDVKLWVTPYDTFWMNRRKDASPYWKANGGPIEKPVDFLTKPEILAAQERRMEFLIDRYGNTGTIFAWEIMNEIDLWWEASPEQIKQWTDRMATYVRSYEKSRWHRNHLLTISFADPEPHGLNAQTAFQRPDLDFATMHLYLGASRGPGPGDAQKAGVDFAAGVTYARSQILDNRPVMDGESGPIDHWIDDIALDNVVFHEMSWRHLMAGGAGPGTRWPYRNPHTLTDGMLETLKAMSLFCDGVSWKLMTGSPLDLAVKAPSGSESASFATTSGAIAWIRLAPHPSAAQVTVHWDRPTGGEVSYRVFDVQSGRWIGVAKKADSNSIPIEVSPDVTEVAVWFSAGGRSRNAGN